LKSFDKEVSAVPGWKAIIFTFLARFAYSIAAVFNSILSAAFDAR